MSEAEYLARIDETIRKFTRPGDVLRRVNSYRASVALQCELCGHIPIVNVFVIKNERTRAKLNVGRLCILRYAERFEVVWRTPARILFPDYAQALANEINRKRADTIDVVTFKEWQEEAREHGWLEDPAEWSIEELSPEGMGSDEIDWESNDWERD